MKIKLIAACLAVLFLIQVGFWRLPFPRMLDFHIQPTAITVEVTPASLDIITLTLDGPTCEISGHTKKMTDPHTGRVTFSDVRLTGENCILTAHDVSR